MKHFAPRAAVATALSLTLLALQSCSGSSDGLSNQADKFLSGILLDTDKDGIPDAVELLAGTDPKDANSPTTNGNLDTNDATGPAGDLIPDGLEQYLVDKGATAPVDGRTDSDNDGAPDWLELLRESDPFSAESPLAGGGNLKDDDNERGIAGDYASDALEELLIAAGATKPITSATDTDGDGIADLAEVFGGSNPFDAKSPNTAGGDDTDADGLSNALEQWLIARGATAPITKKSDTDKDGIPDWIEIATGTKPFDKTHPGAFKHKDVDGDGAPDWIELMAGTQFADANSPVTNGSQDTNDSTGPSGDGISDALEKVLIDAGATAPLTSRSDSDKDNVMDWFEVAVGFDPFDVHQPVTNGSEDQDDTNGPPQDNVTDALEAILVFAGSTAPIRSTTDSDGDGVPDTIEILLGYDPYDANKPLNGGSADTDDTTGPSGDSLSDAMEKVLIDLGASAPVDHTADTDNDGIPDWVEVKIFENPADASSPTPGIHRDADGDGAPNWLELLASADPFDTNSPISGGNVDTNDTTGPAGDGISDAFESVLIARGAPSPVSTSTDTDGDGVPDYFEILLNTNRNDTNNPASNGNADTNDTTGPSGDTVTDGMEAALIRGKAASPVKVNTDTDGDGASDVFEIRLGANPFDEDNPVVGGKNDTNDATGPAGDGISDALEALLIRAGASAPIHETKDSDSDASPDYFESLGNSAPGTSTDPSASGTSDDDNDGVPNSIEAIAMRLNGGATVTAKTDSDGDGIPDWYEARSGTHIMNATRPLSSGTGGSDVLDSTGPANDGVSDALEQLLITQGAASPVDTATDSDADGLPDQVEVKNGSLPFDVSNPTANGNQDTNDQSGPASDGITDAVEAWLIARGAAQPVTTSTDSDSDGVPDWLELINGTDPFSNTSTPPSGSAPVASNLAIAGTLRVGQVLTGSYSYTDADNNPEGASRFRWLRNAVAITGATSKTYTIVEADQNTVLTFEVTPVSRLGIPHQGSVQTQVTATVPMLPSGNGGIGGVGTTDGTSGLRIWYTASRGVGDVPDNTEITTWFDQSGVNNHGATVPTDRPIWQDSGANGRPLLIFGQDDYVTLEKPFANDFTVFAVLRTPQTSTTTNWAEAPHILSCVAGAQNDLALGLVQGKPFVALNGTVFEGTSIPALNDNNWHRITWLRTNAGQVGVDHEKGGQSSNPFLAGTNIGGPATVRVGRTTNGTAGKFAGDLSEFVVFNRLLNSLESEIVSTALEVPYGISPTTTRYRFGATHPNDVAGLGYLNGSTVKRVAESADITQITTPSTLTTVHRIYWAHDGKSLGSTSTNVPSASWVRRLDRTWAYDITTSDPIGTVTIRFRVGDLGLATSAASYALLLDSDTDFSDASVHTTGASYDAVGHTITFTDVPLSASDGYFTLAVEPLTTN